MQKSLFKKYLWYFALILVLTIGYVKRTYFNDSATKTKPEQISMPTLEHINSVTFKDKASSFELVEQEQNWFLEPFNIALNDHNHAETHETNHAQDEHTHDIPQPHSQLLNYLTKPLAKLKIDTPSANLADYGLEKPVRIITIKNKNENLSYSLGVLSPTAELAYIKSSISPTIYGVDKQVYQFLMNDAYFFVSPLLSTPQLDKLKTIALTNASYQLKLSKKAKPSMISEYQFTNSIYAGFDVDQKNLQELILLPLQNYLSKPLTIIAFNKKNLANYGLNSPAIAINLQDENNQPITLFISSTQDKLGGHYAYATTSNFIFSIDIDLYDRLANLKPFVLLNKFVALEFIDDIKAIELKASLASLQGQIVGKNYSINAKKLKEADFKKYYQNFISLYYEGLASDVKPSPSINNENITQIFTMHNGQQKVISFQPYNADFYGVSIDGSPTPFIIGRYQLDNLLKESQPYLK